MKVLLTGATGLLGIHVAGELVRQGYQVRALYRSLPDPFRTVPWFGSIEWVRGAITAPADVEAAMQGCQAVIHAAARTDPYPSDLASYIPANIDSTAALLAACRKLDIRRLVYVSTAAVFHPGGLERPSTEQSPYAFHLMQSGYIASKYQAQQLVLEAAQQGLSAVVVNPAFMLGPYDFKPSSGALIRYILGNRLVWYPGAGGKSFVDVRDAARATVNALQRGGVGNCYLLANENMPYEAFFATVARLSGRSKQVIPVPASLLRSAGRLGSAGERLLRRSLPLNAINAILMTQDNYYSGQRARQELGMPATPLRQTLEETIQWFAATADH